MADYRTSPNPTMDDWIESNAPVFEALRQGNLVAATDFVHLTDLDHHAEERGVSVDELFAELQERVGDLGRVELSLAHTQMDDGMHVTLALKES